MDGLSILWQFVLDETLLKINIYCLPMSVAMDMQYHTPDKCSTGLK
jgi:hypothetical protein